MPKRDARMVSLGYGKFVKADRVYALVPIESGERGDGRRTYVHVDGLSEPLVASRSERAILANVPMRAQASGIELTEAFALVSTFEDGRVIRIQEYYDYAEALEAVGLSEVDI